MISIFGRSSLRTVRPPLVLFTDGHRTLLVERLRQRTSASGCIFLIDWCALTDTTSVRTLSAT